MSLGASSTPRSTRVSSKKVTASPLPWTMNSVSSLESYGDESVGSQPRNTSRGKLVQFASPPFKCIKQPVRFGEDFASENKTILGSLLTSCIDAFEEEPPDALAWRPDEVSRLVREEAEDVRLAMLLTGSAPAPQGACDAQNSNDESTPRFPLSESLRHLHKDMNAMPVGDTAGSPDGEDAENLSPEDVAAMMHRLEHGYSMSAPPNQLFHFLFPESAKSDSETEIDATSRSAESCPTVCFSEQGVRTLRVPANTQIQMKGDSPPHWFPGYLAALPENGGILEVKSSPTEVMQAAYLAAHPKYIPTHSRIIY